MFDYASNTSKQGNNTADMNYGRIVWGMAIVLILAAGACGYNYFFLAQRQSRLKNPSALDEALSRCNEQMESEIQDKNIITSVLNNYNQEVTYFLQQHQRKNAGYFNTVNEKTALIESMDRGECKLRLNVLRELMNTYPKYSHYDNPCIESLESFVEARKAHHENVISIANHLLPELASFFNEAQSSKALYLVPKR